MVSEFNVEHIRECIYAPFRKVVYLRQAEEVVLIQVWRSERQHELPENETRSYRMENGFRALGWWHPEHTRH